MKITFYAAMLLFGLSFILTACNNSGSSKSNSNTSIEKEWTKAMEEKGHFFFRTQYSYRNEPIYMLAMPYVFSKDGTRGIIYAVYTHDDGQWIGMDWYAQYEVNGEHLLLTDIVLINENYNLKPSPRVMKIEQDNSKFVIKGRYPTWKKNDLTPIESFYQESAPSHSDSYIELAESDRYCMHR